MLKAVYYDVVYVRLATTLQWPHSKHTHTHARTYILLLFMRNLRKWRTLQNLCLLRRHFNSLSIGRWRCVQLDACTPRKCVSSG